jgi:putative hydrolase
VGWAYFNTYRDIPRQMYGIKVFCGAEANLMDLDGRLDFTADQLSKLDLVIASCHVECSPQGSREQVTAMLCKAMQNPGIDIIGHPDHPLYPVDPDRLAAEAACNSKALEINNSSPAARPGSEGICREIIRAAKQHGTFLSVGSDAHYHLVVGKFDYSLRLLKEENFPEERVINSSMERLQTFLALHHKG